MHVACVIANVTTTKMLIEAGATLDLLDPDGDTALMYAISWTVDDCHDDKYRCMELLLSNGADVNLGHEDGVTPLHKAMWDSKPRAVELLLRFKADPTLETTAGHRPKCRPPSDSRDVLYQADVDECTRLVKEAAEEALEEKTVAAVSNCLVSLLAEHKQASKRTPRRRGRSQPLAITDQSDSAVGASSPAEVQHALTPLTAAEDRRRNRRGLLQSTRPQESADDEPPVAPSAISAEAISAYQAALRQANKEIKRKKQAKRERAEAAATVAAMRAIL